MLIQHVALYHTIETSSHVPGHTQLLEHTPPNNTSFDPYDLSGQDGEYLTPIDLAQMTAGRSDHAARLVTAARL